MSTIGSGVLGVVQGQAPGKSKASHGQTAGASEEGGFASAIASLSGREGDGGRKGARLSISGAAVRGEQDGGETDQTRVKLGRRDAAASAEAAGKHAVDAAEADNRPFDEKAAALLEAASRQGRKTQGELRDGKTAAHLDEEAAVDADAAAADGTQEAAPKVGTDVGNLLEMLAAPNAVSLEAAAKAGVPGAGADGKAQTGGKGSAKVDAHADAAAKADGAHVADAGEVPQSDTDQLFRLIRADGKGRDLDMSLSDKGDRATFRDATPTGPKGETVTVVDARRYIGLAQAGNAAAVTTAISQDPQWAASLSATGGLSHSEAAATGKVVNTLKIQMHPIELGLVTATLRLHGDDLVVSLQVETGEAYRQLTDDQDAIVRALRGQGFAVDQVNVQLAPADRSSNAQQGDSQSQQQQQFSNQPQAREGGNGRQGGNGEGAGNFSHEGASHEGTTSDNAPGLAGGQPQRSGGVYL
ncbi:flagellar hook-length control protein FliK [Shinella sp. 838]|uniref:flagellar hook-length control protein FliK n=1 Tax=unclassified Shinella TaxID=2643062 RepID=UPI0003C537C0|nr:MULTISPECIES: flagellar hook-length control protein FliK [unclassified Shinella]EYR80386.1 chemotaxis protein MotD [Shinella sp. DD12]MCA0342378.1 flagellar hook-length control protein FliK [Pseudomonadota bacterium]MDG4672259.1 flagellar hook-length control protein FliK [Shinella sp. 838]